MDYYIQGSPTKAGKIKAAFEKLGINVLGFGFADKTVVYCSIGGCVVQSLPYSINLMNILYSHPDYKELELTVQPSFKSRDWIVRKDGKPFCSGNYAEQITLIGTDVKGKHMFLSSSTWVNEDEDVIRLWTIQDAKDGDVLVTTKIRSCPFIYRKTCYDDGYAYYYVGIDGGGDLSIACPRKIPELYMGLIEDAIPATKEQRNLLFAKLREAGYEWDADKKELRKIKPHYDISYFMPKQWVLVRDCDNQVWGLSMFSHRDMGCFVCINREDFTQCIPFVGNEELLGTTDPCPKEFINW